MYGIRHIGSALKCSFGRKVASKALGIPTKLASSIPSIAVPKENPPRAASALPHITPINPKKLLQESGILSRFEAQEALSHSTIPMSTEITSPADCIKTLNKVKADLSPHNVPHLLSNSFLYVFYKEKGFICYESDPEKRNRPTVFEVLKHRLDIKQKLFIIGRLDYNAEGVVLFTDSLEVQKVWLENQNKFSYTYLLKVFGRFNDNVLARLRQGSVIKGKKFGPFFCEVKRVLTSNTILVMKSNTADMRDIKMVLQKNNLRIAQLRRTHFGPYVLGNLGKGQLARVDFDRYFKKYYFEHKRRLVNLKKEELQKRIHQIKETKEIEHGIKYLNPSLFTSSSFPESLPPAKLKIPNESN